MKHKLSILLILCMLLQLSGVQVAKKEERLPPTSGDLAWLIDARTKEDDSLQIDFLPANLLAPTVCAQDCAVPLLHVKMGTDRECIIESVGSFLYVDYDHNIYLHTRTFNRDVELTLSDTRLKTSGGLADLMHRASDKPGISMLLHYKNYITSNLFAMDYIRYYRRPHGEKLSITHIHMNYTDMEDALTPVDNQFHV